VHTGHEGEASQIFDPSSEWIWVIIFTSWSPGPWGSWPLLL